MELSKIKTFRRYRLNRRKKNSLLEEKFNERLDQWRGWANFIGCRFKRINRRFFVPKMLLLKSPWLRNYLYYSSIHHWHRQHLTLFFGLRQDLKNEYWNIFNQLHPVYKERITDKYTEEKFHINSRLKKVGPEGKLKFDSGKSTLDYKKQYQKFILDKYFKSIQVNFLRNQIKKNIKKKIQQNKSLMLNHENRTRVELANLQIRKSLSRFNHEQLDGNYSDQVNNLAVAKDRIPTANKSISMIYRKMSTQGMNFDEAPLQAVDASKKISHKSSQPYSSPTQQNVDLITEKVMEQIDRKLLIWRERTGKV